MLNLVTVVGSNTHMLPHMLEYYKPMVDKIYIVVYRQSENDNILKEVLECGIEPYLVVTEPKYNWDRVTELYNQVKSTKPNDWWIIADDDEFHAYSYDLEEIIKDCETQDCSFVTGGFLDRIGPDGTFPTVTRDTNIFEAFPLAGYFRYPMSGACPNKVTLAKGSQKISSGQHYAEFEDGTNSWGRYHTNKVPVELAFTQVHHFKWDSTCVDRIKDVSETEEEYTYWWEYKRLYEAIKDNNFKINISNPKYNVVELQNKSYIDYKDYADWNIIRDKIVKI